MSEMLSNDVKHIFSKRLLFKLILSNQIEDLSFNLPKMSNQFIYLNYIIDFIQKLIFDNVST